MRRKKPLKRSPIVRKPTAKTKKAPTKIRVPEKKITAILDRLAGTMCRARGFCEAGGWQKDLSNKDDPGNDGKCGGRFEWAHIKSRRHYAIRWMQENCCCLCHKCHWYFTCHPDQWAKFINEMYPGRWEYLNGILRDSKGDKTDKEYWIEFYKDQH